MHRTLRGQPHADVEELADTGFGGQEPNDRRRKRRFSTAARRSPGTSASTSSAAIRSGSKLSFPPRY